MRRKIIQCALNYLAEKVQETRGHVKSAIQAANTSQTRMESRYDTYREEYSMQAAAITCKLPGIENLHNYLKGLLDGDNSSITISEGSIAKIEYAPEDWEIVLVVPGGGGDLIDSSYGMIRLLSVQSCLGRALLGKSAGNCITYNHNGQEITVRVAELIGE